LHERLTEEELALFQWIYLEGAPHGVAAERLGIGLDAAHKRVQRLEARIREIVSDPASSALQEGSLL
jgi:DNA-directed RNA polymerase specialized sigma24 family protein